MPIFERPPLNTLAPAKDRWTPIYLEHGRIEVDDASVKWIAKDGTITRLPVATVSALIAPAPHRPPKTSPRAAPTDAGKQAQYGCLVSGFQLHIHPGLVELHNALTSRTNLSSSRSHVWI